MAENLTAEFVSKELGRIQEEVPELAAVIRNDIWKRIVGVGGANINGGQMAAIGRNADLARWYGAAMRETRQDDGVTLTAGLLASHENARILAHRETGGEIKPKNAKNLRVPLEPALYDSGYDKNAGKILRDLIGTGDDPFKWIPAPNAPKANAVLVPREEWDAAVGKEAKRAVPAWYALCSSVTTAPHPWWSETVKTVTAEVLSLIDNAKAVWEKRRGGK